MLLATGATLKAAYLHSREKPENSREIKALSQKEDMALIA